MKCVASGTTGARTNSPEPAAHAALYPRWWTELPAQFGAAGEATDVWSASKGRMFRMALERIPADELRVPASGGGS